MITMSKRPPANATLTLVRILPRKNPRDWEARWKEAGELVKWEGAEKSKMRAKASSPIWEAIAGIWPDSTGNETPPFAFGSGMGWEDEQGNKYFEEKKEDEQEKEPELSDNMLMELLPAAIVREAILGTRDNVNIEI